ncbi:MAG: hypothetical protein ACI8SE_001337 [Bacteroidia bacterium]
MRVQCLRDLCVNKSRTNEQNLNPSDRHIFNGILQREKTRINRSIMQKEDKQQIEKLLETYKTSLNTADAKLAQGLYTKDGIFMPTEGPSAVGSENILASYEFIFSQIQLSIEFFIEEIEIEGNLAFATTSSKGSVFIHALGESNPEANRELFVFEKISEEWKIARYMFNKTAPKQ